MCSCIFQRRGLHVTHATNRVAQEVGHLPNWAPWALQLGPTHNTNICHVRGSASAKMGVRILHIRELAGVKEVHPMPCAEATPVHMRGGSRRQAGHLPNGLIGVTTIRITIIIQ